MENDVPVNTPNPLQLHPPDSPPKPPLSSPEAEEEPPLEVDSDDSEPDSAFGNDGGSYTTSLTSSVFNHTYENGRRYHSFRSGKYLAPNDDAENDRLDMHHHLATLVLNGKLHVAPIERNVQRILDVGCGTGIWTICMGDEYPSAEVIGIDLSPTQPTMVPPNVRFEIDDIEEPWTFHEQFDLIHVRFMAASIIDWPKLVDRVFQNTKPSGYAEFKDFNLVPCSPDNSLPPSSYISRYHELVFEALGRINREIKPGPSLKGWMERAGFVDVHEEVVGIPIGTWGRGKKFKEIGAWNMICLDEGLEAISLRLFTTVLGWSSAEVTVFLARVRNELKDRSIHALYNYHIVYGRKPASPKLTATTTTVELGGSPSPISVGPGLQMAPSTLSGSPPDVPPV